MHLNIFMTCILLLPFISCKHDHQDNKDGLDDKNWMQFLPNHVVHILKSKTTTLTPINLENSSNFQATNPSNSTGEITNSSSTPDIMYGYTRTSSSSSSSNAVPVVFSVGGLIVFFCIIYCCVKCCCRDGSVISQGLIIQPRQPPPQDPNQPNIVIQHIHATPHLQTAQPGIIQQVHQSHAPPPMVQHIHAPQFQQPPQYPAGYDTRQMLQQEWSPHAPMNQQHQQYPAPDYPYNASAPPPSYEKY